jgi:hypothetical protein
VKKVEYQVYDCWNGQENDLIEVQAYEVSTTAPAGRYGPWPFDDGQWVYIEVPS